MMLKIGSLSCEYTEMNKMKPLTTHQSLSPPPRKPFCEKSSISQQTVEKKKNPPLRFNSSPRTEMAMEFFLAVAALIKLHHFSANFDEGWCQEMKALLFGAD